MLKSLIIATLLVLALPASASAHGCPTPFDYSGQPLPTITNVSVAGTSCSAAEEDAANIWAANETEDGEEYPTSFTTGGGRHP